MDGTEVGVLKEANQVGLAGLLESHDSRALESEVSLEVLGNLPDQALEGQLADEELSGLLVPPDLPKGNCAWPVPMGLLDTAGSGCTLPGSLGGKLLPGGLASSGLPGGLLGTCHGCGSEYTDGVTGVSVIFIAAVTVSSTRCLCCCCAVKIRADSSTNRKRGGGGEGGINIPARAAGASVELKPS